MLSRELLQEAVIDCDINSEDVNAQFGVLRKGLQNFGFISNLAVGDQHERHWSLGRMNRDL